MKLLTLLGCIALVAATNAATLRMPIVSLAHEASPSLSKARIEAMIEAGGARAQKEIFEKQQANRRKRKFQTLGSPAIGVVENDAEYMDFIKSSSTLRPSPTGAESVKHALPLWVSLEKSFPPQARTQI